MPFSHRLGEIPHKRHVQLLQPDGSLYKEQLMEARGFSGILSIVYHRYAPTAITRAEDLGPATRCAAASPCSTSTCVPGRHLL